MPVLPMQKNMRRINHGRKNRSGKTSSQSIKQGGGDDRNVVKPLIDFVPDDLIERCQKVQNRNQHDYQTDCNLRQKAFHQQLLYANLRVFHSFVISVKS